LSLSLSLSESYRRCTSSARKTRARSHSLPPPSLRLYLCPSLPSSHSPSLLPLLLSPQYMSTSNISQGTFASACPCMRRQASGSSTTNGGLRRVGQHQFPPT
jgi:hypothetical protein